MKLGFLITARLKSTRLPMKLLKELNGKSVIENVIDRVKEIPDISDIVLCTSINPQDKALNDIAIENEVYYFNGDEDDVLYRLLTAAKLYSLDYFIGITGENPLFSLEVTEKLLQEVKTDRYDFIYPSGLPIGCATYGMRVKALETVCAIKEVVDTEIWGTLINQPEIFDVLSFEVEDDLKRPDLRITMDYPEDFEFIAHLFENLSHDDRKSLSAVLNYLKENPDVEKVHAHHKQLDLDQNLKDKINNYFKENKQNILEIKNEIYDQR